MSGRLVALLGAFLLTAAPAVAQYDGHGGHDAPATATASTWTWTDAPRLMAEGRSRTAILYRAEGLRAGVVQVHPPRGPAWTVRLDGAARVTPGAQGNYHLVVAREIDAHGERTAATARYFFEPGPDPRPFLAKAHPGLMVLPQELPREHRHFTSGQTWSFVLRRDGTPVAAQDVVLETANGSRVRSRTDAAGVARVTFPSDFPPREAAAADIGAGGHGGYGASDAAFVVSATLTVEGKTFNAAYNDVYEADDRVYASLALGAGALGLGMLAAAPLLRRRSMGGAA